MAENYGAYGFKANGASSALALYSAVELDQATAGYVKQVSAANMPCFGLLRDYVSKDAQDCSVQNVGECFAIAGEAVAWGVPVNVEGTDGKLKGAISKLTTALTGSNNDMVITARPQYYGAAGDLIRVQYRDPAANSQSLSITVNGFDIIVNLATDGGGTITSTAALIKTAIEASAAANALVSLANSGADNGTGVVTAMALTGLAGGANPIGRSLTSAAAENSIFKVMLGRV